jgi:hypothetical protein
MTKFLKWVAAASFVMSLYGAYSMVRANDLATAKLLAAGAVLAGFLYWLFRRWDKKGNQKN